MVFRLIFRELKSSPKFSLIFILNLAIGLIGLVAIQSFKSSFSDELNSRSKTILGGDLSISSRLDVDISKVSDVIKVEDLTRSIRLFSMAGYSEQSRLASIRVIEDKYPFYGNIVLEDGSFLEFKNDHEAYIYPELKRQLNISLGDELIVGETTFKVAGFVIDDGAQSFQMGGIAPRVYITFKGLERAELIKEGSTYSNKYLFKVKEKITKEKLKAISLAINDSSARIVTPEKSSQQVSRILNYINDFLGLVSLSGLFLASMAMMYLFRSFLYKRRKEIAIFQFLGLKKSTVFFVLIGQLFVLSLISSLIAISFGPVILPLIIKLFNEQLGYNLQLTYTFASILIPLIVGILSPMLIGVALILPYLNIDFKFLFSFDDEGEGQGSRWYIYLPWIIFFYIISIVIGHSVIIGSIFASFLFLSLGLLFLIGNFILKRLRGLSQRGSLSRKLAWGFLTRYRVSSLFIIASLMISTTMITLIPTLRNVLLTELEGPLRGDGPALFLFDIQPEQVENLNSFFVANEESEVLVMAPMIRSRLSKIKGERIQSSVEESMTREQERAIRMRNRGVNLSYREGLDISETLTAGRLTEGVYDLEKSEFAEITLEHRYASRLGVDIGDTLEFEIFGIPLATKIVGLREVKWTSFRPNFFIQFQKGVLEDAPKTFVSAVKVNKDSVGDISQKLFEKFPNVSVVDITRAIDRVTNIMESMVLILTSMTLLVFIVGLLVLYSLISHQLIIRLKDLNLLKILGLNDRMILKVVLLETSIIALSSSIIGSLLCVILGAIVSKVAFKSSFVFSLPIAIMPIIGVSFISLVITYLATRSMLKRNAAEVFGEVN
ncbi:putative ABC transport system, membrane protein [Halobacteriovorax marinus SJ]|uniref:ABC transport system, membrane protein n=1 Tax=Halobacteriovorax marinus (strain ATCC BAA-682 / DSM 15412 / SJ) TaxID=862908 RepID=E1WZN4_HALMS|nr:FtsX-like permease family protein [Halobacteriovorax marinus]CBW26220.1 putative ABC transport system, membrane protein [Halobacteriovorax marinus SJ]